MSSGDFAEQSQIPLSFAYRTYGSYQCAGESEAGIVFPFRSACRRAATVTLSATVTFPSGSKEDSLFPFIRPYSETAFTLS